MGFLARSASLWFPGAVTLVELPLTCTNFPTIQELALEIQADGITDKAATIIGGRILTNATVAEIQTACDAV